MHLIHKLALLILLPVCSAQAMNSTTLTTHEDLMQATVYEPFNESHLHKIPSKPDLMPQAGKELVNRLKNPNKYIQPDYIFFYGPKGCGKSTLIDQFTEALGADRVYTHYNQLTTHCENNDYNSEEKIRDNVWIKLIELACQQAQVKKCPHAVIVFDDFNDLYKDPSPMGSILRRVIFKTRFDCGRLHLLVIAESASRINQGNTENIGVEYPSIPQCKQLASYFLNQFKLTCDQKVIDEMAADCHQKSIKDFRVTARHLALQKAKEYQATEYNDPQNSFGQPNLMPPAAKKLIKLLNDAEQEDQPHVIIFHGPPGSGKTTLIMDFMARINGAPAWIDASDILAQLPSLTDENALKKAIVDKFVTPTLHQAEEKNASRAALVINNLDDLLNHPKTRRVQLILDMLFNTQHLDNQQIPMLIFCEAQHYLEKLEGAAAIRVTHPNAPARAKLISYFINSRINTTCESNTLKKLVEQTEDYSMTEIQTRTQEVIDNYNKRTGHTSSSSSSASPSSPSHDKEITSRPTTPTASPTSPGTPSGPHRCIIS